MQQDANVGAGGPRTDVILVELAVVLVANGVEPGMINPDFLRFDEIVDRDLSTAGQPISTPVFSQASFEGGITITAEPNRFVFMQRNDPLNEESCKAPEIARRFLNRVSHPRYGAIGINVKAVRRSDGESVNGMVDVLVDGGRWLIFNDVLPVVGLKAAYSCEDRLISLDVDGARRKNNDGSESFALLFSANIHRDISEAGQQARIERMRSILSGWRDDVSDFKFLVEKFDSRRSES